MGGDRGRLAVVGVDEHAVRQPLEALADAVELAIERRRAPPTGNRSSVTSLVEYCSISWRGEPSATIFALSMTTSRSHSCSASSM